MIGKIRISRKNIRSRYLDDSDGEEGDGEESDAKENCGENHASDVGEDEEEGGH